MCSTFQCAYDVHTLWNVNCLRARTEFRFTFPPFLKKNLVYLVLLNDFSQTPHDLLHTSVIVSYYICLYIFFKCSLYLFSDPRVNDWALMSNPFPTLIICLSYVYISKFLGPKLMENRKPFDLRRILVMYNLIQTLFSTWIFYEVRFFLTYLYII